MRPVTYTHIDRIPAPRDQVYAILTDPKRIVPVTSSANFKGGRLEHVLPGYSIQVMELDLK